MRVLEIIPTLDRGGAEKQLVMLAAGLPTADFEVHVCTLTRSGPLAEPLGEAGIPIHEVGKQWKADPLAYWRLRKVIRQLKPDIVHTWLFAANAYGRQAAWSCGVRRVVAAERCVDRWKTWELAVDRRLARRTSRITANSSGVRDFYVSHGIPSDKFVVIPNAVTPPAPLSDEQRREARQQLCRELELPDDARLIIAVGRMWPQKRYKDLIWAADLLKVIRDDTHLLIVGDGPQRWRLERFRSQVRINDRVHFLGLRSDVPQLLAGCDCFWLGSGYEGQSNALMEAMASGLPVVATDIAGNRDLVVPEQSGHLVAVGDRAALARRTNVLLDDPQLARRLGEAGRRRMEQEFSPQQMISRHADLYQELW